MSKAAAVAVLALLGAGAAVAAARRQQLLEPGQEYAPQDFFAGMSDYAGQVAQNVSETFVKEQALPPSIYLPTQLAAMRATITQAEGTAGRGDPYRVCFGYRHTIGSLSDHPAVTGEWRGEPLEDHLCEAAGFGPGCVSTAAGAYQIVKPTWLRLRAKLRLPDFSPASQDAACDELLRERGAVAYLARGDFAGAVNAARKEWASMPGAGYKQRERPLSELQAAFQAAGGLTA